MQNLRMVLTILLLIAAIIIIALIAVYEQPLISRLVDIIKNNPWPAGIAGFVFLVLLLTGIISRLTGSGDSLFRNGYFQLAVLELFLFSAGLAWYRYHLQQPAQIVLRLQPEDAREYIDLGVTVQSGGVTVTDTVTAPGVLDNRRPGTYRFETVERDIVPFRARVTLEPAESETLVVPVEMNTKVLAVQTEPPGAEVWINGVQASVSPDTFQIVTGDSVMLRIELPDYQAYADTLLMDQNIDLGMISLRKLYTVRISSQYESMGFLIYDMDGNVIRTGSGSRRIELAEGRYRIAYEIGEGQYNRKTITVRSNMTVTVP